jgi:hypothetical protein
MKDPLSGKLLQTGRTTSISGITTIPYGMTELPAFSSALLITTDP